MSVPRKLILMRHGEAQKEGPSDKARILSPHGVAQAQRVGRKLQETLAGCDRAVVSNATRTKETGEHVLASFISTETNYEPLLYTANNAVEFTKALSRHITSEDRVVLVIGHNPIISSMACLLTGTEHGFKPSEYLILTIEADDWPTALGSSRCWTART
ncbi:MAG: histidine phosphatase family protein [Pseudomonadota bacterium]